MSTYYTVEPADREPIEYTHFDCWEDGDTWYDIVRIWEKNLGVGLSKDSQDATVLDLLRNGFDVYESDTRVEIYESEASDE
jgi:hypothetical protein